VCNAGAGDVTITDPFATERFNFFEDNGNNDDNGDNDDNDD